MCFAQCLTTGFLWLMRALAVVPDHQLLPGWLSIGATIGSLTGQ